MGLGKVFAAVAAAAAAPLLHLQQYDSVHRNTRSDDWNSQDQTHAPQNLPARTVAQPQAFSARLPDTPTAPGTVADEMAQRPLLGVDTQGPSRQPSGFSLHGHGYGATDGGPSRLRHSPEAYRSNSWLGRVPEEVAVGGDEVENGEETDEWDLEQLGYYSGSYRKTIALYALVPLTSVLVFIALALASTIIWPVHRPSPPIFPRSLPSPLPEFTLAAALWSLSHLLRTPLWTFSALCPRPFDTLLFNVSHVLVSNVLRLAAIAILQVQHSTNSHPTWRDNSFRTVWWLALGWAAAEAAVSVAQGYGQLALYRNVMVPVERVRAILARARGQRDSVFSDDPSREYMPLSPRSEHRVTLPNPIGKGVATATRGESRRASPAPISLEDAIRLAVDQDMEQLIYLQEREELEEVYGIPAIYIPVFVPCLQRVDSFLFSLGFSLILSWAYLLSPLSFPPGAEPAPIYSAHTLAIAFPLVVVVHIFLSLLHSPLILPRIGVHTTAYAGLLVGLGGFFTGLGLWGVLS